MQGQVGAVTACVGVFFAVFHFFFTAAALHLHAAAAAAAAVSLRRGCWADSVGKG